ncbi:uncharacterized protein LOC125808126 [Solanum verrucosum]|uniref:uncharacterized protein LOC125808126 n=1 Tax=Solanum verrucosum TaxID=315347 RepID=UPI0020D1A79C|nr:uncharacterized protein LOC125808126 [Solanum verrucosum]
MNIHWCTIGDFNVITTPDEKEGVIPYNMNRSFEFIATIEACGLMDLEYTGQRYMWCNQRNEEARVWKRLVNDNWLQGIPQTTITHLPSVGSDHCPLLMEIEDKVKQPIKYFKFLHCWTEHEELNNVVKACRDREVEGNPMWRLQQKMKRLTATPSNWSRRTFGYIFSIVRDHEERVRVAEEALIVNNSAENRPNLHRINVRYIKYLKLEDSILKQKTQLQWFKDGDTNSKYFHAIMRGRRRKLFIHRVCIGNEEWVEGDENIANAACDHFKNIFTGTEQPINEDILQHIPRMVTLEQNMSKQCLLMKNCSRLAPMLPNLISNNQSGFIRSRCISESVMLAQEIIRGIKIPKEGDNVVIKLDMAKAYDRVSWAFTSLEIIGFTQRESPINYLVCPLYIGRQRIIYYSDLVAKVVKKISDWHSRILCFGGKATLIKHVLQSIPIHTMATISPPRTTLQYIKRVTADFFWGMDRDKKKYHWASWESLSFPYEEGGIGVRHLNDVCTSLQIKQWWNFMTKHSLWGSISKSQVLPEV